MCAVRVAMSEDRPAVALTIGAAALPKLADERRLDPNVMASLYILLAKAARDIGNDAEMRVFTEAAGEAIAAAPVEPLVRVHYGVIESLVALNRDDPEAAAAWAMQALDVADAIGDDDAVLFCRQNLSYLWREQGRFDRAWATVADVLSAQPGARDDVELVDLLVNGVHIALGEGEIAQAGRLARRAVLAYCEAPSLLGPVRVGHLFEALAHHQAACGGIRAAELLAGTAHGWFALRNRRRDTRRVAAWLAELPRRPGSAATEVDAGVDPDLLYLGDLFAAASHSPEADGARSLARSVNRLLREIDRSAEVAPCEHAALLWRLTAAERWFTGRSAIGQAAEQVIGGADAAGWRAVELLAGYERLAANGASWTQSQRILRRGGADARGLANLDRLYRQAVG